MAEEFQAITTQEAFDNVIKSRLERCTKTVTEEVTKKFEGFLSPDDLAALQKEKDDKIAELGGEVEANKAVIADLTAKNKAYETSSAKMRIAYETGIPFELAQRLSGDTEEEIRADAEKLARFMPVGKEAPKFSGEPTVKDKKDAAYLDMLQKLKK